jgi:hypothetical protein
MRGSVIWFALAAGWGLDCVLAGFHRNRVQAALTGFFALCFLGIGLLLRNRETRMRPPGN